MDKRLHDQKIDLQLWGERSDGERRSDFLAPPAIRNEGVEYIRVDIHKSAQTRSDRVWKYQIERWHLVVPLFRDRPQTNFCVIRDISAGSQF